MAQPGNGASNASGPATAPQEAAVRREVTENVGAALLFILIGVGAFIVALAYPVGSVRRMGPGAFPLVLSTLMTGLGVAMLVLEVAAGRLRLRSSGKFRFALKWQPVRAIVVIMLSLLAFALLVRPWGLFPATALMIFIATRAEPDRPVFGSLVLALASAIAAALIFVYAVGLPIPLW